MKKFILLSVCFLSGVIMLFSFSGKKKVINNARPASVTTVDCLPSTAPLLTAAAFKIKYEAGPMMVRKNVDSMTTAEINALKVGVLKMRALPYTNPTSWLYQAAIHGTTMPDNLPSWNMCHRAGEGNFFLSWHRMYVYFFERILRSKSGRANLTLPYWNYQINPVIPAPYRDKSPGNPLYDATRTAAMNNGGALPASIMTAFDNSLSIVPYYTFQSNLSGGPHGSVHTSINGNMAVVNTAAKDPVFWLHHSNIDRLWEVWRGMCNGRANPIDTTWLNKTYTFFDETGSPVNIKGSQVVEIAAQLNYRYDDRSPVINCPAARPATVQRQTLIRREAPVELQGQTKKADFVNESTTGLDSLLRARNRRNFDFASRSAPERFTIIFEGVTVAEIPQGAIEVYLNLPSGSVPNSSSNNFVGLLDLFSAEHHSHDGSPGGATIELDATKAAQALGLTIAGLRTATVSFNTRGVILNRTEIRTESRVTIRHIRFTVDRYQN